MTRHEIIDRMGWHQSAENLMSDIIIRIDRIVNAAIKQEREAIIRDLAEKRPGCEHCSHPMWAGIKCGVCGRWYDECRICGKRGNLPCDECMKAEPSEALKQKWADYQDALKRFECPRCGHCCREWQGLTDTEIGMEYVKWDATPGVSMGDFARAIEAALKEKNK